MLRHFIRFLPIGYLLSSNSPILFPVVWRHIPYLAASIVITAAVAIGIQNGTPDFDHNFDDDAERYISEVQQHLKIAGYYDGDVDGRISTSLTYAVKSYNLDTIGTIEGRISRSLIHRIRAGYIPNCNHSRDETACYRYQTRTRIPVASEFTR